MNDIVREVVAAPEVSTGPSFRRSWTPHRPVASRTGRILRRPRNRQSLNHACQF